MSSPAARPRFVVIVLAICTIALVLRGLIVAVSPVTSAIQADLGVSAGIAGTLTSLPVLCFSLATPLAVWLISRAGVDVAVTVCLGVVALGTVIRSLDGFATVLTGTLVIGAAVTIGNVVLPVVIRRDVAPARVGLMTGVYTAALNVGSTITALGTAPLAELWGWRAALAAGVLFPLLGLAAWGFAVGGRRMVRAHRPDASEQAALTGSVEVVTGPVAVPSDARSPRVWTSLTVVMLMLAFGGQAFSYFATTAWVPSLLIDETGASLSAAGAVSANFQLAAVVGAIGVPLLLPRWGATRMFLLLGVLWSAVPLGLIIAPEWWALWGTLGGVAQGGGITTVFVVIVGLSASTTHAAKLSASVQGVGYAIAATAPTVVGFVHDVDGGWDAPFVVVLVSVLFFAGFGFASALRARRG